MNNYMANSEDPDETAHNEPSHQDLHCLQNNLSQSTGLEGSRHSLFARKLPGHTGLFC